jgi:hypothetical protein
MTRNTLLEKLEIPLVNQNHTPHIPAPAKPKTLKELGRRVEGNGA